MIAIVAAMDVELNLLLGKITNATKTSYFNHDFFEGKISTKDVVVTKLGIGKVNASHTITLLLSKYQPSLVINTGIAGGISPLEINDIIYSDKLYYADVDVRAFNYKFGQIPGESEYYQTSKEVKEKVTNTNYDLKLASICTQDKFTTDVSMVKDILVIDKSIKVIDMESTVVADVCSKFNTEFLIIRSISDIVDKDNQLEEYNELESANKVQLVIENLLEIF